MRNNAQKLTKICSVFFGELFSRFVEFKETLFLSNSLFSRNSMELNVKKTFNLVILKIAAAGDFMNISHTGKNLGSLKHFSPI